MRSAMGFAAVFAFPWLVHTTWGLSCQKTEYPLENWKCCTFCPPGEQLMERCTASTETVCEPCEEKYYNSDYTYSDCKKCAVCDKEQGLHELEPCKKTSNTVCVCLPGYSPAKEVLDETEKRCDPCPNGYFSKGGKEKCQPWTNCTANGWKTLRAGKRDEDAICSEPPTKAPGLTAVAVPSSQRQGPGTPTTKPTSTPVTSATHHKIDKPEEASNGLLTIFLTSAGLLLVIGGLIILLFCKKAKKKVPAMFSYVPREDGSSSYRFPVQEEQKDCKSSLAQN